MDWCRRCWRDHSLIVVFGAVLAALTVYSLLAGYEYWRSSGDCIKQPFWLWWSVQYNFSMVAELLGGIILVVGTKYLRERGSPESGDG